MGPYVSQAPGSPVWTGAQTPIILIEMHFITALASIANAAWRVGTYGRTCQVDFNTLGFCTPIKSAKVHRTTLSIL